jgi:hypothetical protein
MKNLFALTTFLLALSFLGCQDSREVNNAVPDLSFQKSIGTEISFETGMRWIEAHNKAHNIQRSRLIASPYAVSASQLHALRSSVSELVGIVFHHALDESGSHHFILTPIDESFRVWGGNSGRIYLDANTNSEISEELAEEWSGNYKEQHPDEIWFHFFGSDIFDEIAAISYFEILNIVPALNDVNLAPQVLLIIESEEVESVDGRSQAETRVYDASNPCPPCPVQ